MLACSRCSSGSVCTITATSSCSRFGGTEYTFELFVDGKFKGEVPDQFPLFWILHRRFGKPA